MISVDKNIPLPAITRRTRTSKYPWAKLEIGDSFFAQLNKKAAVVTVCVAAKRFNKRFIYAPENSGFRIWRVADAEKTAKKSLSYYREQLELAKKNRGEKTKAL